MNTLRSTVAVRGFARAAAIALIFLLVSCSANDGRQSIAGLGRGEESHTIGLMGFFGQEHARQAEYYKEQTIRLAGWRDIFIVSGLGRSTLYRGRYKSRQQAEAELVRVKAWRAPTGENLYKAAAVSELPDFQPGPPEWNLANSNAAYSVLVSVFYEEMEGEVSDRKQEAVRFCKGFRDEGDEAYFLHGPSRSLVCIGAFPPQAVEYKLINGVETPDYKDPRIAAITRKYPFLAENGLIREKLLADFNSPTGSSLVKPPTYPFRVPREHDTQQPASQPAPRARQPQPREDSRTPTYPERPGWPPVRP